MVSEERARTGDWHFQCGHQHRSDRDAVYCAVDYRALGLAVGFYIDGWAGVRLAGVLAMALSQTGRAPAPLESGVGLHSQRSRGPHGEDKVDSPAFVPAD